MKKPRIDFDDILEELGEMGRFQIFTYILVCLPVLFSGANSLSYVFTAGVPEYRCLIPECEDIGNTTYNEPWLEWAIPKKDNTDQVIGVKTDNCDRYVVKNFSNYGRICRQEMFSKEIQHCDEWVFDNTERTIVNDWKLTCLENQWKLSLIGTSHFTGIVIGSLIFGLLADKFGRKVIFVICIMIMSISGALQVLSPNYTTFALLVFINSLGTAGVYPLAFILGVEMVGKRKRELTGIVLNYFYAIGEAIVAPIAWYTRDWIPTQLLVSVPPAIFVIYYWMVPESVRWLMAKNRNYEAQKIINKVAKVNKVILSTSTKDWLRDNLIETYEEYEQISPVVKEFVQSKKLCLRFLVVYFIWGVNAFIFYGLSINSTSLGGNKYLNFALVSLIEIPGYTIAWVSIEKLGRRASLVASLLLCGVTCTLTILVNNQTNSWAVITLFLIGKLAVTSAFGVIYVYTAEMLPTIIRSGGVGIASTVARIGALCAPFVPILGLYYKPLPMILFGIVGIAAGLLAIKLPETLGTKLPETVKEAKSI